MLNKTIITDSKSFTLYELTINEAKQWFEQLATPGHACDVVAEYAMPGISLADIALMCHCEASEFDDLTARELSLLLDAGKELNPHFFRLREALIEACRKIAEALAGEFSGVAAGAGQ